MKVYAVHDEDELGLEEKINKFIEKYPNRKVLDIKYLVNTETEDIMLYAFIHYEEESK